MNVNWQNSDRIYERPTWDQTWMEFAKLIARRSLCDRAGVGAIIVDTQNRPISSGYNGPPKNFKHNDSHCSEWCARGRIPIKYKKTDIMPDVKYDDCPSLHAEQNALITADKANFSGGTIYVSGHLCGTCAKLIANSGLKRVVVSDDGVIRDYRESSKWYDFLNELDIRVDTVIEDDPYILRG